MTAINNDSYKNAGVDVTAGYRSVELMKSHVKKTFVQAEGVMSDIGGFGGLFAPNLSGMTEPVLVSGTDGVGTKLKLAFMTDKHDTVGIDLVAMCVNDIICCGAKPLFFLDYINCDKNVPEKIASIVKGIADGCVQSGCALIGGETAEHPDMTAENEYDLAGFCVGIVDKLRIIGKTAQAGDALIGLASSGVHSNGFSLIRKVFANELTTDAALCHELLTPTTIYVKPIAALIKNVGVKGISNITGGGFYENIPRCLPTELTVRINKTSYTVPAIFERIAQTGGVPQNDMYCTFNMGIGMVAVVSQQDVAKAITVLGDNGVNAWHIGEVVTGNDLTIV
ncbi:MAG: phosphoribosylformylglycinamidine cyclo-ligase [Oscillospiraceae bacterium]|nr:phosphoribosylformylglycinamidine cyclo-ligase [Oscillospiraceae bacterium]